MKRQFLLLARSKHRKTPGILLLLTCALALSFHSLHAQNQIRGKVTDEAGSAMPGVNILIKNTSTGTTTDANGEYAVNVTETTGTLVFSFIGYLTQEQGINGRSVLNIALQPNIEQLNEVVVVGYGVQQKSDITGALVSITSEALREVPAANLQQALQGRAAGVEVTRIGTAPGSTARIRVRGERSIFGSN